MAIGDHLDAYTQVPTTPPTQFLEFAVLEPRDDGTAYTEVACDRCDEHLEATFAPSAMFRRGVLCVPGPCGDHVHIDTADPSPAIGTRSLSGA